MNKIEIKIAKEFLIISTPHKDSVIFFPCRIGSTRCTPRTPPKRCARYSSIKETRAYRLPPPRLTDI